MLQRIREKITGWVAGIILALLAFVFAVWGIDIGTGTSTSAAVVNGEEIPVEPVRRAIQDRLAQFQQAYGVDVPDTIVQQVRNNVIEGFVRNRLLVERVRTQEYRVSDEELTETVRSMPVFQVGGQFSLESYRAMLSNVGYTPSLFEAEQRQDLEVSQLQDGILNSAFSTPLELEERIRLEREKRELSWIKIDIDRFIAEVAVDQDEIEARYDEQPERYLNPEAVDVEYLEVRLSEISNGISVTDDEVRAFYDEEVSRDPLLYKTPEQRRARHILVNIDGDEEEAREKASKLAERAQAGEDFASIASSESDDTGSASLGGDLDWIEPGAMDAPFEDALFSMEVGEIRGPVKTPFGYHVILLEEVRAGETRSFEETQVELAELLRETRAEDIYYDRAESLERLAFEYPDSLEQAAQELNAEIKTISRMGRSGTATFGGNSEFVTMAFDEDVLENRENSTAIEIESGHALVLRVAEYYEATPKPLDEVRDQIEASLKREAAREQVRSLADQVSERLKEGSDPQIVAEEAGATYHPTVFVGRTDTDKPQPVRDAAFRAARPEARPVVERASMIDGSESVILLMSVVPGEKEDLDETEQQIFREDIVAAAGGAELNAYIEELRSQANVVISEEQFQ
ncbi:MAG: SurA N-terminal domain-containing protein [Gammaproteobacteria bacterium]